MGFVLDKASYFPRNNRAVADSDTMACDGFCTTYFHGI